MNDFRLPIKSGYGIDDSILGGCASSGPTAQAPIASANLQESMERVEVEIIDELRLLAKLRDEERNNRLTEEQKQQRIIQADDERVPLAFKQLASMSILPRMHTKFAL